MEQELKKLGYKLIPKRKPKERFNYKAYEELNKDAALKLEEKKGLNYKFKRIN